jgi:V8-like Glu-specific endopeptidase
MTALPRFSCLLIGLCVASPALAVTHGTIATDPADNAVILVVHDRGARCTGTLVAPDLVVLAVHCVAEVDASGRIVADVLPEQLAVFTGIVAPLKTGDQPSARGIRVFRPKTDSIAGGDLAIIKLDRPITDRPIAPLRLDESVRAGDRVSIVGYGRTHSGKLPRMRQRRDDVRVLSVADVSFETDEGPCYADSGAPAFDPVTHALVGVFSSGSNVGFAYTSPASPCLGKNVRNRFTSTASSRALLLDAFRASNATPWIEHELHPALASIARRWFDALTSGGSREIQPSRRDLGGTDRQLHERI